MAVETIAEAWSREVQAVLARAGGKRVFGYDHRSSLGGQRPALPAGGSVPREWTRLCVEGDGAWTFLPCEEAAPAARPYRGRVERTPGFTMDPDAE